MLLDPQHPLSLRWRDLPELISWFRRYSSYAPAEHAARISKAGAALSVGIFDAYARCCATPAAQDLVTKRGRLFIWSPRRLAQGQYGLAIRRQRGIHLDELSGDEVRRDGTGVGAIGAEASTRDCRAYRQTRTGCHLHWRRCCGKRARDPAGKRITIEFAGDGKTVVLTDQRRHEAIKVVLAAGVWSRDFARRLAPAFR